MKEVKCECGHINPIGTIICESCGRGIEREKDEKSDKLIDMRYDGSARRSQTYNKTFVDKIWNFFSSVKVGIWLIVITLIASALGTLLPQESLITKSVAPIDYYKDEYGIFGQIYYQLGLANLYDSWWYLILIASIGISLVICSLDRVIPLYRALKKQGVTRHESFMRRQRVYSVSNMQGNTENEFSEIKSKLKARRYSVREENGNILAEKGRFSRWGPYVNHVGLIIFLIGAMLRSVPGMYVDEQLAIREGETTVIPGTKGRYYLKNEKFILEVYKKENEKEVFEEAIQRVGDGRVVKNFQSNVVLYEREGKIVYGEEPKLRKIKEEQIRVNEPLKHDGYALYQMDFKRDELNKMKFRLVEKQTDKSFGEITLDLIDPAKKHDLGNGYKVEVIEYLPNFYRDDEGKPATRNRVPDNPAFVFKMITPDKPKGEVSFVAIQQTFEPDPNTKYKMKFSGIETKNITVLTVRKDLTLWLLGIGGAIFMIGVVQGMYWNHRRIWIKRTENQVLVAAHTNKNWYGVKNELTYVLEGTSINAPIDQKEDSK
ncbi:cytochrome c biogenesis protein ResB [Metabacillus fastidiosus]|uniref:cytochrome c biogenesis protein ResB n=1 Tax=Metabacillus fastidiosus TaxID=1458 RepID=UPI003D26C796